MSNSALATLTAQYTDSENEDNSDVSPETDISQASQVIAASVKNTPQSTPENYKQNNADTKSDKYNKQSKHKRTSHVVQRLVSYLDDTIVTDDELDDDYDNDEGNGNDDDYDGGEDDDDNSAENVQSEISESSVVDPVEVDTKRNDRDNHNEEDRNNDDIEESTKLQKDSASGDVMTTENDKYAKYAHYGFSLPPEPKGKPLPELTEKILQLYEKMENSSMDMNSVIQQRKDFRNPSIYEKLIQFCDINEFGTNYPPEVFDPLRWGPESYYEELDRVQCAEMAKRQKERKDKDKIEQVSALARKVEKEAKKRKSKWDQPASSKPSLPAALTTTVTGTKGTVISAFGSLPKKPA